MERITSKDNEKIKWLIKLQKQQEGQAGKRIFCGRGDAAGAGGTALRPATATGFCQRERRCALRFHLECTMPKNAGGILGFRWAGDKDQQRANAAGNLLRLRDAKARFAADCRIR